MSFEFLAPDAAEPVNGTLPLLRSPIEWTLRDPGANFIERAGWRDRGAKDVTGELELQAEPGITSSIVAELTGAGALAPGRANLHDDVWWCPIAMGRVLALTPPERTAEVRDRLEAVASAAPFASVIEMTAAYGSNALAGPLSRETFARTMALDLRADHFAEGDFAPVSVARTPGMVLRQRGDQFLHLFGAGFAHYVWTVFVDAARHLGGRAVGVTAIEAISTEEVARA